MKPAGGKPRHFMGSTEMDMTKQQIFAVAHECAKADCLVFSDITYAEAFRNGLRGAYAAARGYNGSFVR